MYILRNKNGHEQYMKTHSGSNINLEQKFIANSAGRKPLPHCHSGLPEEQWEPKTPGTN